MINEQNYKEILKGYLNVEIGNKILIELFGSEKLKLSYIKNKNLNSTGKIKLINKIKKFCNIEVLPKAKYIITEIYEEIIIKSYRNHPLYKTYHNMKYRCYNPNCKAYKDYGGRGITICDEWLDKENGIKNFIEWAEICGYEPNKGLSIDRIDNDKGYSPDNCRWVIWDIQTINRRSTKKKIFKNERVVEKYNDLLLVNMYYDNKLYPLGTFNNEEDMIDAEVELINKLIKGE